MEITLKTNNLQDLAMLIQFAKRLNVEIIENDNWQGKDLIEASQKSLQDIWLSPENDVWDSFFVETQNKTTL